jgi:chlorite dismutase
MSGKTINHFMLLKFSERFWNLDNQQRSQFFPKLAQELNKGPTCSQLYQVSPIKAEADFLVWSALPLENESDEASFFERMARILMARRPLLAPVTSLWGYTHPSMYARGASSQEIDPFSERRQTYLVLYPFIKTIQWYLLGKDARQGMMNQHIRIGRQYPEISQLLLYSFGVQDQEFIVVYETENLYRFSELVNELRSSDVREYTLRDTPVYTGIWRSPESMAAIFSASLEGER